MCPENLSGLSPRINVFFVILGAISIWKWVYIPPLFHCWGVVSPFYGPAWSTLSGGRPLLCNSNLMVDLTNSFQLCLPYSNTGLNEIKRKTKTHNKPKGINASTVSKAFAKQLLPIVILPRFVQTQASSPLASSCLSVFVPLNP